MWTKFDYEGKIWGGPKIKPSPFFIQGLKLKYFLEDLKGVKGKVLDIGCGAGNICKAVKRYRSDLDVYGVDLSHAAINLAKKDSQGVRFRVGATDKLPYKSGFFDAVSMFDVLEHVDDVRALKEVRRVLKKGGLFHLFLPLDAQPGTFYYLMYKVGWQPKNKHTGHIKVYTDTELEKMAEKAGFKLINKRFSFHFVFSLFDMAFFSLLELFNLEVPSSIEGMIESRRGNPFVFLFNLLYRIVVFLGNVESLILKNVPGGGGHFTLKIK